MITNRLCEHVMDSIHGSRYSEADASTMTSTPISELEFVLTPEIESMVARAQESFQVHRTIHSFCTLEFSDFGKGLIKTWGMSPDAVVQMALQLAFFKLHGRLEPTYESSQTRAFAYGRTEVTRSLSIQALRWVRSMAPDSRDPPAYRLELLRAATEAHVKYMADAVQGKGVDRHLMGLKLLVQPHEKMPDLFLDPAFSRSKYWRLSSSQISHHLYESTGWGAVVPDGFGFPYQILESQLFVAVESRMGDAVTKRMRDMVAESLREIQALVEASKTASAKSRL